MSAPAPELLLPLRRFRLAEHAIFEEVVPEEMPSVLRRLLVHGGDMTSRLENFHNTHIRLEVRQSERTGAGAYFREVLLLCAKSDQAVEYGAIEIFLEAFDPAVRAQILEGKIPLGGLLNSSGMRYRSEPQAYFRVTCGAELFELLDAPPDAALYGRCNVLRTEAGDLLARIVEVLPLSTPAVNAVERAPVLSCEGS